MKHLAESSIFFLARKAAEVYNQQQEEEKPKPIEE